MPCLRSSPVICRWANGSVTCCSMPSCPERTAEAHRTILAELLALRKILLNLQFSVAAGEPVTRDRMLAWIEEADADKGDKARARLTARPGS